MLVMRGRCQSGRRWFWFAALTDWSGGRHCDEPICVYGGPHEHGWADTEQAALASIRAAVVRLGGDPDPVDWRGRPDRSVGAGAAASALKRINSARRTARPPSSATDAGPVEYLYGTCYYVPDDARMPEERRVIQFRITRRTAKRIYYIRRERGHDGADIGFVSREALERDGRASNGAVHWSASDSDLYATRELAEAALFGDRRAKSSPDLRQLRREMADARPDRGGTNEAFIAARERYERALRQAS
jgi:hypothetical protein